MSNLEEELGGYFASGCISCADCERKQMFQYCRSDEKTKQKSLSEDICDI
jgi:hypothetical protein